MAEQRPLYRAVSSVPTDTAQDTRASVATLPKQDQTVRTSQLMTIPIPAHALYSPALTHAKSKKSRISSTPNTQLRYHRRMRNWTQANLADELYCLCATDEERERGIINAKMISRWEQGENIPSLFWQKKLCVLFGTTPDKLGLLRDLSPVSITGQLQSMQQQVSILLLNASLFKHPNFQRGVAFGREAYYDEYEGMLSEEEMITLVEEEVSRRAYRREACKAQLTNDKPLPFLLRLGVVIGVINEAMVVNTQ